jgi:UDP-N-acetylmuramyl tripeptide synthase
LTERLARLTGVVSRATGAGAGTNAPGRVLERLSPAYITDQAAALTDGTIVVSGTNGKTTTASMIRDIMWRQGFTVVSNSSGGNLPAGIASALLSAPRSARMGVFEVDEAALPRLVSMLRPRVLVLMNVFRDQLDRFGEPDRVLALFREAVGLLPVKATVVANADDCWLWDAVGDTGPVGFGVVPASMPDRRDGSTPGADPEACPACGHELTALRRSAANLGSFRCERCGWSSPTPAFESKILAHAGLEGTVFELGGTPVTLPMGGIHNVYNATAAVAAAVALGVPLVRSIAALERFEPRFGRAEMLDVDGKPAWLALIKNPAGAAMVIEEVASDPRVEAAVISVSDRAADGRDISWIWDADFERLASRGMTLVPSGRRARDVAVRIKYTGATPEPAEPDPLPAIRAAQARTREGAIVAVLATYTAMLDIRGALAHGRKARVLDSQPVTTGAR